MSIWHKEVTRLNGSLMAYIEVQNDYTGAVKGGLRTIHLDGNRYYCVADSQHIDVTSEREKFLAYEDKAKTAIEWWNKTKF